MEIITKSARETQKLGEKLADKLKSGGVVCLLGELGSGKTTFVQGVARGLGIKQRIISPTFVFIRPYYAPLATCHFYHLDLYRIEKLEDSRGFGLEEILSGLNNIVVIEWAEKIKKLLPKKRIEISFEYVDETTRKVHLNTVV